MRRIHGFTLGIIAASLVLLVCLGLAFFYTVNLFGGGRELTDAVDSGTVSLARNAVRQPAIALNSIPNDVQQFAPLCDPQGSNIINLLTYNRLVGYALLVSANAKAMGSSQANSHANNVWQAVASVGQALTSQIVNSNNYTNDFNRVSTFNNTSLLSFNSAQSNAANKVKYVPQQFKTAYYNSGKASNIYISQALLDSFSALSPNIINEFNTLLVTKSGNSGPPGGINAPSAPSGQAAGYLAGYVNIPFLPNNAPALVPVLPNLQAHLISKTEFNQALTNPVVNSALNSIIPPNAFEAGGVANRQMQNTSSLATAIAAATVGCPPNALSGNVNGQQVLAGQYPLAMPGGYIKIYNYPGAPNPGLGSFVSDGSNSIFNNELYTPSSITMTDNGIFISGSASFASKAINAWATYNNPSNFLPATTTAPAKRNPALYPPNLGYPAPGASIYRYGAGYNQLATITDLENIHNKLVSCTSVVDYGANASGPCISSLSTWINNFGAYPTAAQAPSNNYTAAEYMKTSLLEQWNNDGGEGASSGFVNAWNWLTGSNLGPTANVSPYSQPTGVKLFNHNGNSPSKYPTQNLPPQQAPQFGTDGTPWQLLAHIGNMNYIGSNMVQNDSQAPPAGFSPLPGSALFNLMQRCQEIKPGVNINELYQVLNSQILPLGQTFYLYLNPKTNLLVMDTIGPAQFTAIYGNAYLDQASLTPDGNNPPPITSQAPGSDLLVYSADSTLVDTQSGGGAVAGALSMIGISANSSNQEGDALTKDQPFDDQPSVTGYDAAVWIPASGYHNFLGVLQFQSNATGGGQYSSIN